MMKKLLVICLFFLSLPVFSQTQEGLNNDWLPITDSSTSSFFVNVMTIKQEGQILSAWIARVDTKNKLSSKTYNEYDCKKNQFRFLSQMNYEKTNFTELKTLINQPTEWVHIPPGSTSSNIKQILCK
jgi:hypothetical protein